ncbi:hypothetical protein M2G70_07325 [Vibrio vulnificus]|nr:hypothetical protein [Vibrio vulnificus]
MNFETSNAAATAVDFYDNTNYDYDTKLEEIESSLREAYVAYDFYTHRTGARLLVSELGDVWNLKTLKKLTPTKSSSGYYTISLSHKGTNYNELLHKVVADVHLPNAENLDSVDHILPNKEDNTVFNLQHLSLEENQSKGKKEWPRKPFFKDFSEIERMESLYYPMGEDNAIN